MDLGWKAAVVAALAVLVIVLKVRARKHDHDAFRTQHMRRKIRVPMGPDGRPRLDEDS